MIMMMVIMINETSGGREEYQSHCAGHTGRVMRGCCLSSPLAREGDIS
jgi:hypothetical protein